MATAKGCDASAILLIEGAENSIAQSFSIYPNPAAAYLKVSGRENNTVELFDVIARRFYVSNVKSQTHGMDVSRFESGTYTLRSVTDKESFSTMVVVR